MPPEWTVSLGEANEQLCEKFDISRERQDAFAYRSHQLAAQAWQDGFYDDLIRFLERMVSERFKSPGLTDVMSIAPSVSDIWSHLDNPRPFTADAIWQARR